MVFILQIALGVCGGMLLFIALTRLSVAARSTWPIRRIIGLCVTMYGLLWAGHMLLTVYR